MNHYLTNIAARSAGDEGKFLNPVSTESAVSDEQSSAEGQDNFQHNELVQQSILPDSANQIQSVKSSGINNKLETPLYVESNARSYFSRHTKRLSGIESGNTSQNDFLETKAVKFEEDSEKAEVMLEPIGPDENKSFIDNKTGLNALPEMTGKMKQTLDFSVHKSGKLNEVVDPVNEQKQFISPLTEVTKKADKLVSKKMGVERIVPNLERNENKRHIQNKKQQTNPKLVIGKITVEILPPIATGPPKTITRVVSPSSKPTSSKSNKLIFGLGQM